jgi:hypothetical protein
MVAEKVSAGGMIKLLSLMLIANTRRDISNGVDTNSQYRH